MIGHHHSKKKKKKKHTKIKIKQKRTKEKKYKRIYVFIYKSWSSGSDRYSHVLQCTATAVVKDLLLFVFFSFCIFLFALLCFCALHILVPSAAVQCCIRIQGLVIVGRHVYVYSSSSCCCCLRPLTSPSSLTIDCICLTHHIITDSIMVLMISCSPWMPVVLPALRGLQTQSNFYSHISMRDQKCDKKC